MMKTNIKNYLYLLLLVFAACTSYRFLAQTMYKTGDLPSGGVFTHIQVGSVPATENHSLNLKIAGSKPECPSPMR